ncbi:MAG: CopD family protein [Caldimonas sp.]|nr:CopD family protein [Pseudomonadota bacterium]
MASSFLWVKALHIVFVSSWFAALFYLPRIFINLREVAPDSHAERERLLLMARKLYRFSSGLMVVAIALGLVLWLVYGVGKGPHNYWLHAKIALVLVGVGYHHACGSLLRKFEAFANVRTDRWLRVFNEMAVLLFTAIVVLVVVKPF